MTTKTMSILIGNSDNKLTQNMWAHYTASVSLAIKDECYRVHFEGGSDWNAPWQNACWVVEINEDSISRLKDNLTRIRKSYEQDSVAIVLSDTEFI